MQLLNRQTDKCRVKHNVLDRGNNKPTSIQYVMHTASVIRLIGMHCLYRYSLLKKSSEDTKHMGMRASSVHACWSIRAEIQAESWHFCFDNDILNIIRTLMIDCVCFYVAKFGTPNTRLETLFQYIPDVRRLGLWHYKMTTDPSLGVAQQRQS